MKRKKTWLSAVIGAVLLLCLAVFIQQAFGPHHPKSFLDISGVPAIDTNVGATVLVTHADGSTAHVDTKSYEDRFLLSGRVYARLYTIPGSQVQLGTLLGYSIYDSDYVYFYSLNGLSGEEWLVEIRDSGKQPNPAEWDELVVSRNLEITEIPGEMSGLLREMPGSRVESK